MPDFLYGCSGSTQILTLPWAISQIPNPCSLNLVHDLIYPRLAWDSLCSRGWSWTLNPPPMCWDYSHAPPCLVYVVWEVNCMASEMLVKHSTKRAGSQFPGVLKQTTHPPRAPELQLYRASERRAGGIRSIRATTTTYYTIHWSITRNSADNV